ALVLFDPTARWRADDGYLGLDDEAIERFVAAVEREWGTGFYSRINGFGRDERAQHWQAKCERLMYTPSEATGVFRSVLEGDFRSVLPTISVPTLVVARANAVGLHSQSRYVADHISGAKYVELSAGSRQLDILDPVEQFVTGRLPE